MTKYSSEEISKSNNGADIETSLTGGTPQNKEWWTATHTITLLGFCIFNIEYMLRNNLSVTVLAMKKEFSWDELKQGQVLGAFYYGYILTNFFGGRAAEYFGGKIVLGVSVIITGLLTVVSPAAVKASTPLFIAIRVCEGLAEGVCFPAMIYFLTKWVPKTESARTATRILSGSLFGTFITLPVGGWITSSFLGWESVFYLSGSLGIILGIIWIWMVTDDPRNSHRISPQELEHILKNTSVEVNNEVIPIPLTSILTCSKFWMTTATNFGSSFGLYMLLAELPTYLVEIMGFSLSYAGTIAGSTYLASWMFGFIYSALITKLNMQGTISMTFSRRLSQAVACYGNAIGFFILLFTDQNPTIAVVIFIFNGALFSAAYSGCIISYADIAPRFAGSLVGLGNTISSTPGFIAPIVTGALTYNNQTVWAWRWLFIITIIMYAGLATPYIFFFKPEVEKWNDPKQKEEPEGEFRSKTKNPKQKEESELEKWNDAKPKEEYTNNKMEKSSVPILKNAKNDFEDTKC